MNTQTEAGGETTLIMVDDDIDEIFLTRRQVRKNGIINRFVSEKKPENLLTTLDELREMGHDASRFLLLLDVNMPRMNGFRLLQELRDHPDFANVPVIMFSASDQETDRRKAEAAGANGYMTKPFDAATFFAVLSEIPQIKKQLIQ